MMLPETLHALAFKNEKGQVNTLGRPLMSTPESLASMTSSSLKDFTSTWYTPNRIVVSGIGVQHDSLVNLVEKYFPMTPPSPSLLALQSARTTLPSYNGGILIQDTSAITPFDPTVPPQTHIYMAFESPSSLSPQIYPLAILNSLMGGGGSFSAGGPGKGMYTRLYTSVLNKYHWIEQCHMFNYSYAETGLFGIMASIPPHPQAHTQILHILSDQLLNMTVKINDADFERAKNQLKSNLMMGLESRLVECEDLGRQVGLLGKRVDVKKVCERIDGVSKEDVLDVARMVVLGLDSSSPSDSLRSSDTSSSPPSSSTTAQDDKDEFRVWNRSGPYKATVLMSGPIGTSVDATIIEDTLKKFGLGEVVVGIGSKGAGATNTGFGGRKWRAWGRG